MGLDMYLYLKKSKYISSFRDEFEGYPEEIKKLEDFITKRNFASLNVEETYQIMYWRKANAIHKYFVDRCGDGEDNCQEMIVKIIDLQELNSRCLQIMADHSLALKLLPPSSGFFFGPDEIDEYYFSEIEDTSNFLQLFLKEVDRLHLTDKYAITYQASW